MCSLAVPSPRNDIVGFLSSVQATPLMADDVILRKIADKTSDRVPVTSWEKEAEKPPIFYMPRDRTHER